MLDGNFPRLQISRLHLSDQVKVLVERETKLLTRITNLDFHLPFQSKTKEAVITVLVPKRFYISSFVVVLFRVPPPSTRSAYLSLDVDL